ASPWHATKENVRHTLVAESARALRCPVAYINVVGGNDELIFDGRSIVCDAQGKTLAGLAGFSEELRVIDVRPGSTSAPPFELPAVHATFEQDEMKDIFDALVLGLRDYTHKSGFKRARRSEEHTSELQSPYDLVCRLLLEK